MTTQPEAAVGGEAAPAESTDSLESIIESYLANEEAPEDEQEEPTAQAEGEEETVEGDEPDAELDETDIEADLPPIEAPISWTAEDKEAFANLPRNLQETVQKREAERERFVQSKAQEAAQARQATIREAAELLAQREAEKAEQLEKYARQFAVQPPDPRLLTVDANAYAEQLAAYQHYTAQSQNAQREAEQARAQQAQYEQALFAQEQEEFAQRIAVELPEILDPTTGPKLKQELRATAQYLGFSEQEIDAVTAGQLIALKKISDVKAKADKYDALMKRQMERVRAGKTPPPIAKPGAARNPEQVSAKRAEQAFAVAKTAKGAARVDAFGEYLTNSGLI